MLFDPSAHYALEMKREDLLQSELYDVRGRHVSPLLFAGNPQPLAATLAMQELAKMMKNARIGDFFRSLIGRGKESSVDASLKSHYESSLGISLPVSDETFTEMLTEVKRYKWIEAERAGRDIWAERNPKDPEASALAEWFRLHFGAWYMARRQRLARG